MALTNPRSSSSGYNAEIVLAGFTRFSRDGAINIQPGAPPVGEVEHLECHQAVQTCN